MMLRLSLTVDDDVDLSLVVSNLVQGIAVVLSSIVLFHILDVHGVKVSVHTEFGILLC